MRTASWAVLLLPLCAFAAEREVATLNTPYGWRSTAVAAASDRAVLAVWSEPRTGLAEPQAMLLDHDGEPLRERNFRLTAQTFAVAAAASDGRDFLVAGSVDWRTVGFMRVRENGEVVALPARVAAAWPRALVFTGGHYVLLHLDEGGRVSCSILNAAGEVLRESVLISPDPLYAGRNPLPTMAADGAGGVLILWRRDQDTIPRWRTFTVTELLAPGFPPVVTPPGGGNIGVTSHDVAWNGSEYLLVYTTLGSTYLHRVDRAGRTIQTVLVPQEIRSRPVWTGSQWLFPSWSELGEAALVSFQDNTFHATRFRFDPVGYVHTAVPVNGGVWAAWVRPYPANQLYADVIRADGTRGRTNPVLLSAGSWSPRTVSLAPCGDSTFAAAWTESEGNSGRMRMARFASDGRQLGSIVTLREVPFLTPSVACDGGRAVVVWSESGGNGFRYSVVAAVVEGDRAPSPPLRIGETYVVIAPISDPVITRSGDGYLVAYANEGRVMLAALDRQGQPAGPPQPLREPPAGSLRDGTPAVVSTGSEFFVSWLHGTFSPQAPVIGWYWYYELRAVRLGPTLAPRSAATEMEPGSLTPRILLHGRPVLAASPHGYLMVFTRERPLAPLPWERSLRFARFDRNGVLLDPPEGIVLSGGSFDVGGESSLSMRPFASVAWSGSAYEVAAGDRIYSVAPDGSFVSRRAVESGLVEALVFDGTQPLMLFSRPDPVDGSARLWVTTTTAPGARRRASP